MSTVRLEAVKNDAAQEIYTKLKEMEDKGHEKYTKE